MPAIPDEAVARAMSSCDLIFASRRFSKNALPVPSGASMK